MGASPRSQTAPGGGVSMMHLFGYMILLLTGFQAGRMACSGGDFAGEGSESPATQRAIISRINRLERLAEAAALATPALQLANPALAAGAAARSGALDPLERDSLQLRKLANTPAGSGGHAAGGPCKDVLEKCAAWAAAGECTKNAHYMAETCAKSCKACGGGGGGGGGGG
ncbi:hypothetical protein T492DRAFT_1147097, partial [Pavlovales sp. CCMP2436]